MLDFSLTSPYPALPWQPYQLRILRLLQLCALSLPPSGHVSWVVIGSQT